MQIARQKIQWASDSTNWKYYIDMDIHFPNAQSLKICLAIIRIKHPLDEQNRNIIHPYMDEYFIHEHEGNERYYFPKTQEIETE